MEQRAQSQVHLDSAESRQRKSEAQFADAPTNEGFLPVWTACEEFEQMSRRRLTFCQKKTRNVQWNWKNE